MPHFQYLLIFVTCIFYCFQHTCAANNNTDAIALLHFKAGLTSDPLRVTSSWNTTLHFCYWDGVSCGRQHHRVTALNLHSSMLSGSFSPYIGNLSFLSVLNLQNNSFTGTIPPEISRLHRLHSLRLNYNLFVGEIPRNISACSNLIYLDLEYNMLVGGIPPQLGLLFRLQYLDLSLNSLTGSIISSLGNLTSLSTLDLTVNMFVGRIPDSIGNLKNLTLLSFAGNKMSGSVPISIFNLSSLLILDLGVNYFEGEIPFYFGITLPHLEHFSIGSNRFRGIIPASLSNSSNLHTLQLGNNSLQGTVPSLHNLHSLRVLTLFGNSLGGSQTDDLGFISSLPNATMLQVLAIGRNNFTGILPRVICNFTMIQSISIYNNQICGQIPNCIENIAELQVLYAQTNQLSGVIPHTIGKLQRLNALDLHENNFVGEIPSSIGNLSRTTILDLSYNNLEGQVPSTIGSCTSLLALDLSNNNITGGIPFEIFALSTLSIGLFLHSNRLSGTIPEEIGYLKNVEILDVSGNMLSGKIPSSLSTCMVLNSLNMSGNMFQGTIPEALQTLKGLLWLNLSRNNLSGVIPIFLSDLPLQMLNLSYNNLEGQVPIDGVFGNASRTSIVGNARLCGGIPELSLRKCPSDMNQMRRPRKNKKLILAIISGLLGVILVGAFVSLYILRNIKWKKNPQPSHDSDEFPNLSYQSLSKATNGFAPENMIGSGAFGVVYKGVLENEETTTVAIKVFNLERCGASKSFMAECEALRNIRHRNLLKVITVCSSADYQGNDFKALLFEYMANGSLEDWLYEASGTGGDEGISEPRRSLKLSQRFDIVVDIAVALDYLHHDCGASVVHCDLKPSNVLLDDNMVAHVGDFGLAKILLEDIYSSHGTHSSSIGVRGTIGYTPPEYGLGSEVSTKGDVYSFGILLLEMLTGIRPSDGMFTEGLSLHKYVKSRLPDQMMEILDRTLLEDIVAEGNNHDKMLEAVLVVLEIGVACSAEQPQERLGMAIVAIKLSSVRNKLYQTIDIPKGNLFGSGIAEKK